MYVYVYMYIYVYVYMCIFICMCVYMCVYVYYLFSYVHIILPCYSYETYHIAARSLSYNM